MFETSMVLARTRPARSRIGLLTASVVAHTAVIVGGLALSVAAVDFPQDAPNESAIFMPAQAPPPLGTPDGGRAQQPRPAAAPPVQKQQPAPPPPDQITAPPEVPDETPVLDVPSSGGDATATGPAGEGNPGPFGVPWGDPDSVGDLNAPPATTPVAPPVEEKIYTPGGEVKAPVLLHRVDPAFPELMRKGGVRSATVVVRCVIDRNGRVREPEVVVPAMQPFNDAVVRALQQWRYQPGSYRGQAVETYLHVTVHFGLR